MSRGRCEDFARRDGRRRGVERRRRCDHVSRRKYHREPAQLRFVAHGCAERAKRGTRWKVCRVELTVEAGFQAHANAPSLAFGDEPAIGRPEPVGESHKQRINRRKDASPRNVRANVLGKWASVDQHRHGGRRWE